MKDARYYMGGGGRRRRRSRVMLLNRSRGWRTPRGLPRPVGCVCVLSWRSAVHAIISAPIGPRKRLKGRARRWDCSSGALVCAAKPAASAATVSFSRLVPHWDEVYIKDTCWSYVEDKFILIESSACMHGRLRLCAQQHAPATWARTCLSLSLAIPR